MAGTAWKWCLGCGIGCVVIIIAAASLGVGGLLLARGAVKRVEQIADLHAEVERQYGPLRDYAPSYGAIPSDRLDAFIRVRQAMEEHMGSFGDDESFPPEKRPRGFLDGLKALRGGVKAVSIMGRLVHARDQALLEQQMGFGEYYYLYCTVYYAWLGHSPLDCPRGVSVNWDRDEHSFSFRNENRGNLDEMYRATMEGMLRKAVVTSAPNLDQDWWVASLRSELDALERDSSREPWDGGLPPRVIRSLDPFRAQLEKVYWKASNCFDLATLSMDRSECTRFQELEEDDIV